MVQSVSPSVPVDPWNEPAPAPPPFLPAPAGPAEAEAWDAALDRAIAEGTRLGPITRVRAGDGWRLSCLASSSTGQQPYRVAVEAFGPQADTVSCSCPGGQPTRTRPPGRCKHAAALLATVGLI